MSTRVSAQVDPAAANVASLAPDGGLYVPDQAFAASAGAGPAAFWTIPNHLVTSSSPQWYRGLMAYSGTAVALQATTAFQPLFVARPCYLYSVAIRVTTGASGASWTHGLWRWTGPGMKFTRYPVLSTASGFSSYTPVTDASTSGVVSVGTFGAYVYLEPGQVYLLGSSSNNSACQIYAKNYMPCIWPVQPANAAPSPNSVFQPSGFYTHSSLALEVPAPALDTIDFDVPTANTWTSTTLVPMVFYKLSPA